MSAEPYTDVATHMRDELRRVWLRIEYQLRLQAVHAKQIIDEATTSIEMAQLIAHARRVNVADVGSAANDPLQQWLAMHAHVEERIRATIDAKLSSPLVDVIQTFDLSQRQWATIMFALMPEIDPNLVPAYQHLVNDSSCRGLDGRLLSQLVYDSAPTRPIMARDLSASSPLVRHRLIEITSPSDSLMFRRIRAAGRLLYLMDGGTDLDPDLVEFAELREGDPSGMFSDADVERATSAFRSKEVVLVVQGQRGLGKKALLQRAASHWNQRLVAIDAKRLSQLPLPTQQLNIRSLVRELLLLDALPAFVDVDDATVIDADRDALPACVDMFLDEWQGPVALTINRERMPRVHQRPLVHLTLEVPSLHTRSEMWQMAVPTLSQHDADDLSGRFAVPGGIIIAAAHAAAAGRMPGSGAPTARDLEQAVAGQLHQRMSRLGKRFPTPFALEDLIVDDDTRAALLEIMAAVRQRRNIRDQFNLRGSQGISVLFSGHPGVGKTMSATVLAKHLGLDIYEIDLSQVVSKWLGETEKNLSDLFDAAEPGHVVLLFNEADSLFGKRTSDASSSNDRYANMETNYLLQRLERFNGLAILTTNLTRAIDQAFKRRFSYDVYFTFPSPDMRAELWRRTLPTARRSPDIDFDAIAEDYELSGGFIKVACERAAYVAGANGASIDEQLLRATITRMYRERGKLSTVGPLE